MASRQSTHTRLHCTVTGCRVSVGRKADLLRHQEEKHGEMKFCSEPGCDYEGTRRTSRLKAHMEKKHPGSLSAELVVPDNEPSGSQYPEQTDQAGGTYSDQTGYDASSTQAGCQYPVSPAETGSSTATSSWSTAYASSVPASNVPQTTHWSSTPQYQAQYQTQYQTQYETQEPHTWSAAYYPETTYQTTLPSDSNAYDTSTTYIGGSTSTQEYAAEGWDEEPHYTY